MSFSPATLDIIQDAAEATFKLCSGGDIPARVNFEHVDQQQDMPAPAPMRKGIDVRRFRITQEILDKHGYTVYHWM